jgi:four helix bundle protein
MSSRYLYPFEKLRVWQDTRHLICSVYSETKSFPKSEIYGLTSQMNRAAVSVGANIAEGSARMSRKDQAHFSEIAYGSLMEVACLSIVSVDLTFLTKESESKLRDGIESVSRQLNALRNAQLSA